MPHATSLFDLSSPVASVDHHS